MLAPKLNHIQYTEKEIDIKISPTKAVKGGQNDVYATCLRV